MAGLESSREVLSVLLGDVEAKGGALELTKQLAGWDEFLPLLTVGDVSIAISANIVTDSNGSRLVLSSETTGKGPICTYPVRAISLRSTSTIPSTRMASGY